MNPSFAGLQTQFYQSIFFGLTLGTIPLIYFVINKLGIAKPNIFEFIIAVFSFGVFCMIVRIVQLNIKLQTLPPKTIDFNRAISYES
ncbi:MAG: hypothetical protein ACPGTP_08620, partial [Bacteroidia bacterium]